MDRNYEIFKNCHNLTMLDYSFEQLCRPLCHLVLCCMLEGAGHRARPAWCYARDADVALQ